MSKYEHVCVCVHVRIKEKSLQVHEMKLISLLFVCLMSINLLFHASSHVGRKKISKEAEKSHQDMKDVHTRKINSNI